MKVWAVIPAAGVGTRMGADLPKQYLPLRGKTIIEHTLQRFVDHPRIDGVMVALAAHDEVWPTLEISKHPKIHRTAGGRERCHSVLNALKALAWNSSFIDWALVHDAARPCLRRADIDCMLDAVVDHPVGGILALPVRDTMKRADENNTITETIDRTGMWHALTPQMFRIGPLASAIESALAQGVNVTDEAQAMELSGQWPLLVEGHADNIKVTRPQDLVLAEIYLRYQEETACA
ncbi:MAG: 2-C-methyl-D-erythritol 4-phosphate cytidylyltransferase [Gammaproteobacteria bacterium]